MGRGGLDDLVRGGLHDEELVDQQQDNRQRGEDEDTGRQWE